MDENEMAIARLQAQKAAQRLRQRGFEALVREADQVIEEISRRIPDHSVVGYGGSETLRQLGILDELRSRDVELLDRDVPGLGKEEKKALFRRAFSADYYLLSANAVTLSGQIINVDGTGNRVAAMCYGPDHVIIVAGTSKIVPSEEEAWQRVRQKAAPANNVRLKKPNPCTEEGSCCGCMEPTRICNEYVKLERCNIPGRITVILVPGSYGY